MAALGTNSKSLAVVLLVCCVFSLQSFVRCADPDEVLDFCVAVLNPDVAVWQTGTEDGNWPAGSDPSNIGVALPELNDTTDSIFPCKDLAQVVVGDFTFSRLGKSQTVTSKIGSVVTPANVLTVPGLNTLGISGARIDFVKGGVNPPHIHPRATEVLLVLEGCLLVGFVDTNNELFTQVLQQYDVFVFPKGMVHFQIENGLGEAHALAFLTSQNPGTSQIAMALLGSSPKQIPGDVIESAFKINENAFKSLVSGFRYLQS